MFSPLTYAAWLLCGLGAVVFVSAARRTWQTLAILGAALAAARWFSPGPQEIGLFAAVAAVVVIVKPRWDWIAAASAGVLTGALGYSVWFVAFVLAAALAAYAIPTPRRIVREEALAGIAVSGVLLALTPSVAQGWQSALALNIAEQTETSLSVPNWVLLLAAGSLLLGGFYQTLYKRR